jgi:TolA-binding protein
MFATLSLAAALLSAAPPARTAEDTDALRQKDAEVQRLRRSLEQAEKELEQLRRDNERLRQQQEKQQRKEAGAEAERQEQELKRLRRENERLRQVQERPARDAARPPREAKPVRPLAGLPPLTPDTVVEADVLVAHFTGDPAAAAARYGKQTFRVKGAVDRFHTGLITRNFTVLLASPDRAYSVACRFNYIDRYKTVFTTQNGRVLTARYDSGREVPLLEAGQTVVIAGRCGGLDKDGVIEFSRCEIVQ